jgi:hypothetical protein
MRRWWYRSAFLIVSCAHVTAWGAPTEEAKAYLSRALTLLQAKHINSNHADWSSIKAKAQLQISEASTTADTYEAIRSVLTALAEKHSFLMEPRASVQPPTGETAEASGPAVPLPKWRLVAGRYGLIQLPQLDTLSGGREDPGVGYTEALRSALTILDKQPLCGWIVDLRENGGGDMWPMLQGLDPLLGSGPFGYFVAQQGSAVPWVRTPAGIFPVVTPATDTASPVVLRHRDRPVAVLIGPGTSSSGEMTALALIGRVGVRTFGEPSAGYTTANVPYLLSDGAFLVITETKVRDRAGKDYDGPIIPDEHVRVADGERAASDWLRKSC